MALVKSSIAGQIIIPTDLRVKYGITSGVAVRVVDDGDRIVILPALKDPIREARGMFLGLRSLVQTLREERGQRATKPSPEKVGAAA